MADSIEKLVDMLDTKRLQSVQDAFAQLTNITTVIVNPQGTPLTRYSNLRSVCEALQKTSEGQQACARMTLDMCDMNRQKKGPVVASFSKLGLVTAAVPFYLNDIYLGSWLVEQVRLAEPLPKLPQQQELDIPLNTAELLQLIDDLPVITFEQFEEIYNFLLVLSENVVVLGSASLRASNSNRTLTEITKQLEATSRTMRKFIDSSDVGIYVSDYYTGELLMVNKHYAGIVNIPADDLVGQKCWNLLCGPEQSDFCSFCPRGKLLDCDGNPGEPYKWENYIETMDTWFRCTNQAITWTDGRLAHLVTFWDVTEEHKMRDRLAHLAYYDQQMGLPNSLKLAQDIDETHDKCREGSCFLVCFDITYLRRVNDAYGRETGDQLLRHIVNWINEQPFGEFTVYRIEGDAFGLGIRNTSPQHAAQVADTIFKRFAHPWVLTLQEQEIKVYCNAAVSVVRINQEFREDNILDFVQRTLDVSRDQNKISIYNDELNHSLKESVRLQLMLKNCIENNMQGFEVHFQPIVKPAAGTWKGLEALCRWKNPENGPVSPLVFIHEAEQLGLIGKLGYWVLETSISNCKKWKLDDIDGFFLSVNLSPIQIMDDNLSEYVMKLLKKYDYPGEKLCLEVTESTRLVFNNHTLSVIENLRFRGIRISLDDFGSGYSSFNNLKNLPVSFLKTEGDFIRGIEDDSYMQYFYYIMAQLAHATDMHLIAEGVETRDELEIVLKNGADYIQGYYFSRPLSSEQLEKQLNNFTEINPEFYSIEREPLDTTKLLSKQDSYLVTPSLFQMLNKCMQILLSRTALSTAIPQVLEIVGNQLGVSRTYIFERVEKDIYSNTYEWLAPGTQPRKDVRQKRNISQLIPSWIPLLKANGMVVSSDTEKLPDDVSRVLHLRGIKAIAALPILQDEEIIGFLGVSCYSYRQEWVPEEILTLRNLCMVLASCIKRDRMQAQIEERNRMMIDVLNRMQMCIWITELDTEEIVWVNDTMQTLYSDAGPLVGKTCYEALYGFEETCPYCKIEQLLHSPPGTQIAWEHYSKKFDKTFMVYDSLLNWEGNRLVHLGYLVDISEYKSIQKRLQFSAATDPLTGALNRTQLIEELHTLLTDAQLNNRVISVAYIDVDKLKIANDTYGHSTGDRLIVNTVDSLRAAIGENGIIGRMGGDEFIALIPDQNREQAEQHILQARNQLAQHRTGPGGEDYSFSFGVVESTELEAKNANQAIRILFDMADERMREYKKANVSPHDTR